MTDKYSERHVNRTVFLVFTSAKKKRRHELAGRKPQMKSYCKRECLKYSGSKLKLQLQRPHDFRLLPEINSFGIRAMRKIARRPNYATCHPVWKAKTSALIENTHNLLWSSD